MEFAEVNLHKTNEYCREAMDGLWLRGVTHYLLRCSDDFSVGGGSLICGKKRGDRLGAGNSPRLSRDSSNAETFVAV